jgi:transcriptional regulator with XRE-family HTH domain
MTNTLSYAQRSLEPYCIGLKLRALRTRKRLTLSRLAAETGLSTALLSKLETDRMIPTLPTLAAICRVHGVGLGYFFSEPASHTISITRKAHLDGNGHSTEPFSSIALNSISDKTQLMVRVIEFNAGGASWPLDSTRDTSGMFYVLEGRLNINAGVVQEVLETGDCAYIESEMTMALHAAGKLPCRVLAVVPAATNRAS